MKKLATLVLFVIVLAGAASGQTEIWQYKGNITFPPADTAWARPYLCTFDAAGNLWVMTTASIDTAIHNAIFKAAPGAAVLTKVYDFRTTEADLNTGKGLSGMAALGNDIMIFSRINDNPGAGAGHYFKNGDPANKLLVTSGGYGTHMYGSGATKDSFIYSGISAWGNSIRVHNFSTDAAQSGYGAWVPFNTVPSGPPFEGVVPTEPGGPTTAGGIIRDLSLIPGGNYNDTNTVFYTSRNSDAGNSNGGIAVWKGGTQKKTIVNPDRYRGRRVIDTYGDLTWASTTPNGIAIDTLGRLWACGTDSTRRYVRVYTVDLTGAPNPAIANEEFELPSKNSSSPDLNGADMKAPADVALRGDKAYVSDIYARKIFIFQKFSTGVPADGRVTPSVYALDQNYPNPFNPATTVGFRMPKSGYVSLKVYNLLGQPVATLVNGYKDAGSYRVTFNAGRYEIPSGVYLYQLITNGVTLTNKMLLTK